MLRLLLLLVLVMEELGVLRSSHGFHDDGSQIPLLVSWLGEL